MSAKGPTLHQVADRAGVSIATVSRVARGLDGVSPETRERVERVIRDLQYHPNALGRALVRRRHDTIGVVFPGIRGPYYSEVIHGFELQAVAADMSVLILGTEHVPGVSTRVLGVADRADGLAIMGGAVPDDGLQRLVTRGVPLVTMAASPIDGIPNVRVDNYASTVALTTHLIHDHGYRELAFAGTIATSPDMADRWAGFLTAHHNANIDPPSAPVYPAWDQHTGAMAAHAIQDAECLPQAVVCGSDEIAVGMLSAFAESGMRIPDEIAITGWDDIVHSEFTTPPLTTVAQPARTLGQETARILLDLIRDGPSHPAGETVLSTEPVIRASCGCAYQSGHSVHR